MMTPFQVSTCFAIFTALNNAGVESFQSPAAASARRGAVANRHPSRCYEYANPSTSTSTSSCITHFRRMGRASPTIPFHLSPDADNSNQQIDSLISLTSNKLRAYSWFSWWSQLILTVVSSITFLFARNVMNAQVVSTPLELSKVASKFFLPGLGVMVSVVSIIWTWGQRRLARRLMRQGSSISRVEAANLLRRVIKVGVSLNLIGLLTSVLGAQYIIGTLVAKSMQSFAGFGGGFGGGIVSSQTLQPLDVLVVQANTNVLSSHFVSLVCLLLLTRMVDLLDPPSLDEDDA